MEHQGFKVAAAGRQDVLVGPEESVVHHDDHITQVSFVSLLVQLHQKLLGIIWLFHFKDFGLETCETVEGLDRQKSLIFSFQIFHNRFKDLIEVQIFM